MQEQLVPGRYTLDNSQSTIGFEADILLGLKAKGRFHRHEASITVGASAAESSIAVVVWTDSIDTGIKMRDRHLRADNVFATGEFPTLEFRSEAIAEQSNGLEVTGSLRVRDVTRPITFHAERLDGTGKRYSLRVIVSPKEFGITRMGATRPVAVVVDAVLVPA
jgi:polyisoprenoid-binding protein YceI